MRQVNTQNNAVNSYYYNVLDFIKFLMALLVIIIHRPLFNETHTSLNYFTQITVAGLAVPFFFACAGFLFYGKWRHMHSVILSGFLFFMFYGRLSIFLALSSRPFQDIIIQDLVNGIDWIRGRFYGKKCVELDIDRQKITPFGTPQQIDSLIRDEVKTLSSPAGGLYMIYGWYPGVPLENARALMDAMEKYMFYWD